MRQDQISWTDAERVVRLHREMTGQPDQVPLSSLARSLGKTEDEVLVMLDQVRYGSRPGRRRFSDPGGWLSAGIAAVAIGVLMCFGVFGLVKNHLHAFGHRPSPRIEMNAAPAASIARVESGDRTVSIQLATPPAAPSAPDHA